MKQILLILFAVTFIGCADDNLPVKAFAQLQQNLNTQLDGMYDNIAQCNDLAKCLGQKGGKITVELNRNGFTYLPDGYRYGADAVSYACIIDRKTPVEVVGYEATTGGSYKLGVVKSYIQKVDLKDIAPTLMGCQAKSCGNTCSEKGKK